MAACGGNHQEQRAAGTPAAAAKTPAVVAPTCPATAPAAALLPGVTPAHLRADYWLERMSAEHDIDQVLLSAAEIRDLHASTQVPREGFHGQRDLLAPFDAGELRGQLAERFAWLRDQLATGAYVRPTGERLDPALLREQPAPAFRPELRVALAQVPFYCAPTADSFLAPSLDPRIDRNRCSTAHAQEVIQVLAAWPGGMQLARTRYAWGWIAGDAALSPPIPGALAPAFVHGPFVSLAGPSPDSAGVEPGTAPADAPASVSTSAGDDHALPRGTLLPLVADRARRGGRGGQADRGGSGMRVHVATATGFVTAAVPASEGRPAPRPLTRRALVEEAFRYLGQPYGFGGKDGGRDCSRLLLDIFESFGIRLPRHSGWQARAGSYSIDVSAVDEGERQLLIDAAAAKGIVLLHLPGHIMLYLGRDHDDRPMVLHAFAEYMAPCDAGAVPGAGATPGSRPQGETLHHVDRVQVSDLELGRGTSKTALIERITRVTVFGAAPGPELAGVASLRPAAPVQAPSRRDCRRAGSERIFVSPARPDRTRPLRVVATAPEDPGAVAITLIDPAGVHHTPDLVRLGGPPHGFVATVDQPARGRWTAVLGDGARIEACQRFYVHSSARGRGAGDAPDGDADSPVWPAGQAWTPALEDLYAVFVERLFDHSIDEDITWPGLHLLLRDQARNLLHDHLGKDEDEVLTLLPDCADLPYTLRAYFAWKLRLPFGYRSCRRARPERPPRCHQGGDNLMSRSELGNVSLTERDAAEREEEARRDRRSRRRDSRGAGDGGDALDADVVAFARFVDYGVRRTVHSSSGRTHPGDDDTDFYPVPLTRRALRPGTLFTDPYGHLLIVADWIPQGAGRYGVLVGADAQPDGTVGRRRFWRGSFLFDPDTASGGAGFKAFRPWALDDSEGGQGDQAGARGALVSPTNRDLRDARLAAPYDQAQYRGSADDFYDAMHALINPRPLEPVAMLISLVDALEETVSRRVTSVQTGEDFMRERGFATIDMPEGADIFLTTGPWEDYATPSRDLRLLISLDTVVGFPDVVARAPARFGVRDQGADALVERLRARLDQELAGRSFRYTRSDGSAHTLTLADVIARQKRLEMAYNPNDCIEVRWGAAPDSAEMATCNRHALAAQREGMERYRDWFVTRKRPAN